MKKLYVLLFISIFIVGCSDKANTNNDANAPEENSFENNNGQENNNSNNNQSLDDNLPDTIEVDEEIRHPSGVNVTIESVTFNKEYFSIDFRAEMAWRDEGVYLTEYDKEDLTLQDDTGTTYEPNRELVDYDIYLDTQSIMEGTLVFAGPLKEDVSTLTLTFNPSGSEDDKDTTYPKFEFEIDVNK